MPRHEFTGRWGFTTPSGIPKPIHRAFELLHASGDQRIDVARTPGGTCGSLTTAGSTFDAVQVVALANSTEPEAAAAPKGSMVFVSNNGRAGCNVTLSGLATTRLMTGEGGGGELPALLHRIDSSHGNPYGLWQAWGSPSFPSLAQIKLLQAASSNTPQPFALAVGGDSAELFVEPNALLVLVL